jgi:hypothetical protein
MSHILSPPRDRDSEAKHRRTEAGSTFEERAQASDEDRALLRAARSEVYPAEYGGIVDAAERATQFCYHSLRSCQRTSFSLARPLRQSFHPRVHKAVG